MARWPDSCEAIGDHEKLKGFADRLIGFLVPVVLILAGCASGTVPGVTTVAKEPTMPPPAAISSTPTTAPGSAWEQRWQTHLTAAKREGKVTVASSVGPETRDAMTKAFSSKFGIELEFVMGTAAEVLPKVQAERRAGLYAVDATINGTSSLIMFKNQGLLGTIEPALVLPEVTDPKMWFNDVIPYFDKYRTGIGFINQYNSCVLRNTDLVKEGEIASYDDLLKPQWKDKVVSFDPSMPGSGNAFFATLSFGVWNVEQATNWFRQMLKEQNLVLTRDARLQVEWVARGKYPVGLGVNTDPLVNFFVEGAPLAQQKVKEGGFITSSIGGLGLFDKPAHPNGSIVFVNWLLSRDGQIAFTSGFGGPSSRKDMKVAGAYALLAPMAGDKAYIEDEEHIAKKVELQKVAAQLIVETSK